MRERWEEVRDLGAEALVVTFSEPGALTDFRGHLALPYPVSADPERRAYEAYGVGSGPSWRIWGPRAIWSYVQLVSRGRKLQKPKRGDDLSQLGADFVLDSRGRVAYARVSRSPADRPAVDELLDALRSAR